MIIYSNALLTCPMRFWYTFRYQMQSVGANCNECQDIQMRCERDMERFDGVAVRDLKLCATHMAAIRRAHPFSDHRTANSHLWKISGASKCKCELCVPHFPYLLCVLILIGGGFAAGCKLLLLRRSMSMPTVIICHPNAATKFL